MSSAKKFVSETEIAANKERVQAAWDATRGPNDPVTAPEPEHDRRTLFERLEENRVKKQEEYEDAHRLKNMVKGLEDEDVEFLSAIDQKKMEDQRKVKEQERLELEEFRKRRAELDFAVTNAKASSGATATASAPKPPGGGGNPQKALLLGAVKRKGSGDSQDTKRQKPEGSPPTAATPATPTANGGTVNADGTGNLRLVGCLPGMGNYTDSSASSTSSDSEPDSHNLALHSSHRRKKNKKHSCG